MHIEDINVCGHEGATHIANVVLLDNKYICFLELK